MKQYFVVTGFLVTALGCATAKVPQKEGTVIETPSKAVSPATSDWVQKEGIRCGYVYPQHDPNRFSVFQDTGINSVILKEWRFKADLPIPKVLNWVYGDRSSLAQWGPYLKKNGIHLFFGFNWGQHPSYPFRRAVFDDGGEDATPCPRCPYLWTTLLPSFVDGAMENAKTNQYVIDGVWLDCEMYFTSTAKSKYYQSYTGNRVCYCDDCFSRYFRSKGSQIPEVAKKDRYSWLSRNSQLESYQAFLKSQVEGLAAQFSRTVRGWKPDLLIGIYPSLFIDEDASNWVLLSMARGLGSEQKPVLVFETSTYGYYGRQGHTRIPKDPEAQYARLGVRGQYIAGYLFRRFSPREIEDNLVFAAQKASGYWLFRLPTLWNEAEMDKELYSGTPEDYLDAIKRANAKINRRN